jgi:hypothetical protein
MRFDVLTVVKMSVLVLWVAIPVFQRNIPSPSLGLRMEVSTYNSMWRYNPEDQH